METVKLQPGDMASRTIKVEKEKKNKEKQLKHSLSKPPTFKIKRDEKFQTYFKDVICAGTDRLTKLRLIDLMAQRYPSN